MSEMRSYKLSSPLVWTSRPAHSEIASRAYDLWVRAGRPEGRDVECWLEAEAQMSSMWRLAEKISSGLAFAADAVLLSNTRTLV